MRQPWAEPLPTDLVVALAMSAYGLLIVGAGLIWTRAAHLAMNLLAAGGFFFVAGIVWRLGRRR